MGSVQVDIVSPRSQADATIANEATTTKISFIMKTFPLLLVFSIEVVRYRSEVPTGLKCRKVRASELEHEETQPLG